MKAATVSKPPVAHFYNISIHAAREGGDGAGEAELKDYIISIHAAREGGDPKDNLLTATYSISIHAAREGGDARY